MQERSIGTWQVYLFWKPRTMGKQYTRNRITFTPMRVDAFAVIRTFGCCFFLYDHYRKYI